MKIAPNLPRAIADLPSSQKTTTATSTAATTKPADPAPVKGSIEDVFGAMPGWKKVAVVAGGIAGLAVGGMIGEQIGMGLISNMLPDLTMTAYFAIPLATTLSAALVGTVVGISPFFHGTELT